MLSCMIKPIKSQRPGCSQSEGPLVRLLRLIVAKVPFTVTSTLAKTKAEKKNKDDDSDSSEGNFSSDGLVGGTVGGWGLDKDTPPNAQVHHSKD